MVEKNEKSIAIITARGGSKRIPRKNIREFCGKPILCYSIEAALLSGCFDTVMVSTDDEEIAAVARNAGAEIPFMRSAETANDYATTSDVLKEVIERYKGNGKTFQSACCIYPTAPFVTALKLQQAMEVLYSKNAMSVMPVVQYSFPPQRSVLIKDGLISLREPECFNSRSQDLEPIYHDAGQFYVFDVAAFEETGMLIGPKTRALIISDLEVQDIDNFEDWKIAEMKYEFMCKSPQESMLIEHEKV